MPSANASPNPLCEGSSLTLSVASPVGGETYAWSGPGGYSALGISVTIPNTTTAMSGIYTVTASIGSCVSSGGSVTVTVNPDAAITLTSAAGTNAQTPCVNTAITSITYSITGGGTGATVTGLPSGLSSSFNGGVFTISGTPTQSGTFSYTVNTTGTCAQTPASGSITVNPNATIALTSAAGTNAQTKCINTSITPITYSIQGGGTGAVVTGLPSGIAGALSGSVFTISGTATVSGTFNYSITTTGTCAQAVATGIIIINALPSTPVSGNNSPVCIGSTLILTSNTTAGATYSWTGPDGFISSSEDPIVSTDATLLMSGTYTLTVTVAGCTSLPGSTGVVVNPNPIVDAGLPVTIISGNSTTLTASGGGQYLWSTGETTNSIIVSPAVTTEYCVIVTLPTTCSDSDCVRITVEIPCGTVFVPLAFSPNGDNENDVLTVYGNCITYLEFAIFDRWGEKVFETSDPSVGWDGTHKGKKLDPAVFVYYLKATVKGEAVSKHGNITLTK